MNFVGAVPCHNVGFSPLILQTFISFLYQNEGGKWRQASHFQGKGAVLCTYNPDPRGHTLADQVQGIHVRLCTCAHDDAKVLCWSFFQKL